MELFRAKYREFMKNVSERQWKVIKQSAEDFNQTIEQVVFNNCITVKRSEIKDYPKFYEEMIVTKMVETISKPRQETYYKLTSKGIKNL